MDARQLPLPLDRLADRDEAYLAELERAALPAAARRVARWMIEAGHPQRTAEGERLYAVAGGQVRQLAVRSRIPRSTLHRGLKTLGEAGLAVEARGCLCLVASRLCEMAVACEVVPSAPTDDWGRIYRPRPRSPERPTSTPTAAPAASCPNLSQFVPTLSQLVPACPNSVPACPNLSQPGVSSISARAPVVVVDLNLTNNNSELPDPAAVKQLARRAWAAIHAARRRPPRPEHGERLLLLRCAWLALVSDLGERWLMAAAQARPLRGDRQDPLRFFTAAAAYQAWQRATGEPAETDDERREARRQLRDLLARVTLPAELIAKPAHGALDT